MESNTALLKTGALAAVLAVTLAGCAQGPTTAQVEPAREPPPGFGCPAAGTTVRGDDGRMIVYAGAARDDAEFCVFSLTVAGQERTVRALFNIAALTQYTPGEERTQLRNLFPFAAGKRASWQTHNFYGEAWQVTVTIVGREQITIPAGTFTAWRQTLNDRGFGFNSWEIEYTRWVLDDGTVIRQTGRAIRGVTGQGAFPQTWAAVQVLVPN
ncbi:hypothetical protein [Elioraea sp.]|uniref:hypothetical protein n=1 Tax=Elioraea sp. TaxID=2185103 RepID=UPI0025B8169F|nr:hypothetical protein [Elioraea sp.]